MDDPVEDKLRAWGLEPCIPAFRENGIDAEAWDLLDVSSINSMIPQIGLRLKFLRKFEDERKVENVLQDISLNITETEIHELACQSKKRKHSDDELSVDDKENEKNITVQRKKKVLVANAGNVSLFPNGLKAFLEGDMDGKVVLKHREKLTESDRRKLTKVVVDHLFRHHRVNKKITTEIFERACDEVIAEFPTEQRAIYFVPYKPKTASGPRTLSCGKFWSKYINYNRSLAEPRETGKEEDDPTATDVDSETEALAYFEFLKSNLDPPDRILHAWEKTFKLRQVYRSEHSIQEYFTDIPILKTQQGHSLLTADFEHLHGNRANALYESWKTFSKNIVTIGTENKLFPTVESNNGELKDSEIVYLLPLLFPATTAPRRKSSKPGKTSKEEARKSFFLHVQNSGNIVEEIEKKRTKLLKVGATMQPFIVAAGPIEKLSEIYVIVDDTKYKMASAVQAVDVCFKIFFALNSAYPFDCQHIWTFIQHYVYEIYTPTDKSFTVVASLSADFSRTKKEMVEDVGESANTPT